MDKVFKPLGSTNHSIYERPNDDYYATDPNALRLLLKKLEQDGIKLPKNIYEPCCGGGHLAKELNKHGYSVISHDLYNHGYGEHGKDFLKSEIKSDCILTNPPYKYALEFVEKALGNCNEQGFVIMILKIQFLEGKKRNLFFKKYPPKYVYVHSQRQNCARNGNFKDDSAVCYSWFIWEKGFTGEPVIRWID